MARKRRERLYPLPEAANPGGWDIKEAGKGTGYSNQKDRVISVPLDDSPLSRAIRRHESLHVKHSPKHGLDPKKYDIPNDVLQVVEDCRIHELAKRAGISDISDLQVEDQPLPAFEQMTFRDQVEMLVAKHSCGFLPEYEGILERLQMAGKNPYGELAVRVARKVRGKMEALSRRDIHLFKNSTQAIAKDLAQMLEDIEEIEREREEAATPKPGEAPMPDDDGMDNLIEKSTNEHYMPRSSKPPKWGKMIINEPRRPVAVKSSRFTRRKKSAFYGPHFRSPMRLMTDGKAFQKKIKVPGGTVLIDASGSMSLTPEEIRQLLECAPAATVACYDGNHDDGVLKILAKDETRVEERDIRGDASGSNIIDGPALTWLAEQEGPRIWVSDGWVTGIGDAHHPNLVDECLATCLGARISRLDGFDEALEFFQSINSPAL